MIVATAGHIDHGKTALVKALTGVDTDRLPEEKARGISIDIGFAYWTLPSGDSLGFVDVPGHERFVHNMLAGVCGIDFVMLVVAADDGVMPQTVEHLHIVDLLQVRCGVAVITKSDRVSPHRVEEAKAGVRNLLGTSALANVPLVASSTATGEGIAALRDILTLAASERRARATDSHAFRYAIDRAFTVAGSGTVVTGTAFDGRVGIGDRLILSPHGAEVRVRGIQIAGVAASQARAGERAALNIVGVNVDAVGRGDWIVEQHAPTTRIDARLRLLPSEKTPLRHWTQVHLHIGAADVSARIAVPRGASVEAGETSRVQLVTDSPIATVNGDRFIVRDQSATRTIGGGVVLDPAARARRNNAPSRAAQLDALETLDAAIAFPALLAATPGGVDLDAFRLLFNLRAEYLERLVQGCDVVVVGRPPRALPRRTVDAVRRDVIDTLFAFHRDAPQAAGMVIKEVRDRCAPALALDDLTAVVRTFAGDWGIEVTGAMVRMTRHDSTANRADDVLWQRAKPLLDEAGLKGLPLRDLGLALRVNEGVLKDLLHRKAPSGDVVRVSAERFYPRSTFAQFAALAQSIASGDPEGKFTAAQFRDGSGINRTLAIEVLECLDRLQITQRIGDVRKMRKDFVPILGPASVPVVPRKPLPAERSAPTPRSGVKPPHRRPHPFKT
jgi:selenocysteine-specific elongation factor